MPQPLGDSAFWVLTALAHRRLHGYAILLSVSEVSTGSVQLKPTTLYAVLDRLVAEGLVQSDGDEVVNGRTRRYFTLTETGADRLQDEADRLTMRLSAARAGLRQIRVAGVQS